MTVAEELRHRIDCVRKGTPDGYGEVHSLDLFAAINVTNRLFGTMPLSQDDPRAEYNELFDLREEARKLIKEKRDNA